MSEEVAVLHKPYKHIKSFKRKDNAQLLVQKFHFYPIYVYTNFSHVQYFCSTYVLQIIYTFDKINRCLMSIFLLVQLYILPSHMYNLHGWCSCIHIQVSKKKERRFRLKTKTKNEVIFKPSLKEANQVWITCLFIEKKESICRIMRGKNTTFQVFILYATFMF